MNLGKLLGAGKSFISGGKPAAYREDKRFYLPQFVSPKNPFAQSGTPSASATSAEPPKTEAPAPTAAAPVRNDARPWTKTEKMPVAAPRGASARASAWVGKLNPAAIFGATSPAAHLPPTPVQAELSLEKVKVVHNDLTDADVEVVPMKSRPARELASPPAGKKSWAALGERIMKATAL